MVMRWLLLLLLSSSLVRAAILNVADYGAIGDCTNFYVTTTSGSATVVTTNSLGAGAVGKVMEIFNDGPLGVADAAGGTITNQDMVVTIVSVSGFNVTVSSAASKTATRLCTFGTNNSIVFQHVQNVAANGDTISIPSGNYLLIPTNLLATNSMSSYADGHTAVVCTKGGLIWVGAGTNSTILTAVGAWQNRTNSGAGVNYGTRGFLFWFQGAVTNDAPIVFDRIQFSGGLSVGKTGYDYFPARTSDGDGWDVTHGAFLDIGTPPLPQLVTIQNCLFTHWRGEILKSVVANADGYRVVTNCTFIDGNATANNFSFSHRIDGCWFEMLKGAQEFYQAYSTQPSYFKNSTMTNISGVTGGGIGITIVGAETGHGQPKYTISGNSISAQNAGIFLDPVQNLDVVSNLFLGCGGGVSFGVSGYQGTTNTWGVLIQGNRMTNTYIGISSGGNVNQDAVHNVQVVGNIMKYADGLNSQFANGNGWNTNMYFTGNVTDEVTFGLLGASLAGQWFIDDVSNNFPYYEPLIWSPANRTVSYNEGMRWKIGALASSTWSLDATSPNRIPPRAEMLLWNASGNSQLVAINPNTSTNLANGQTVHAYWDGDKWVLGGVTPTILTATIQKLIIQ